MLFLNAVSCAVLFFFCKYLSKSYTKNTRAWLHAKFYCTVGKNCAYLFIIWKLYANKPADWHTWQMIMMLSICCHAMPSLTIFKQALSVLLWLIVHDFNSSNKIKLPKMLRFLQCKHVALLPWKQCRSSNFSHSLTFFYRLGIERKKFVWTKNNEKTKERLWDQNLLKPSWSRKTKESGLPV